MMKYYKNIYCAVPESRAIEFKTRVAEYNVPGGMSGILRRAMEEWLRTHPPKPLKKSSAD